MIEASGTLLENDMNTLLKKRLPPKRKQAEIAAERQDRIILGTTIVAEMLCTDHAREYRYNLSDIRSKKKGADLVAARQECIVALRNAGLSLPEIGKVLGCHHTTCLLALRRASNANP